MLLSKPTSYAIRALTCLATYRHEGPILSTRIASEQSIPAQFLIKILGTLTTAGLVRSTRGPGGGFELAVDPRTISLLDVLNIFEGVALTDECLLGLGRCSDNDSCPVHHRWKTQKLEVMGFLRQTNVAELARMRPDGSMRPEDAKARRKR
ncbi:Rrf2 family transcriptional regulator [candidate division KSB1 bacterium]|nr:Rrf2 family transcriptional regulator [candidate division KSB1 bacterium]